MNIISRQISTLKSSSLASQSAEFGTGDTPAINPDRDIPHQAAGQNQRPKGNPQLLRQVTFGHRGGRDARMGPEDWQYRFFEKTPGLRNRPQLDEIFGCDRSGRLANLAQDEE